MQYHDFLRKIQITLNESRIISSDHSRLPNIFQRTWRVFYCDIENYIHSTRPSLDTGDPDVQ